MTHNHSTSTVSTAVLTVSDSRSKESDLSGDVVTALLSESEHRCHSREIVPDSQSEIQSMIQSWMDDSEVDAIIVTGGTGASKQDVTPDTIAPMCTALLIGFGELFRQLSYEAIGSAAMLSRAGAGFIDCTDRRIPIFFLPGSPNAVELAMKHLIAPQLGHLVDICREKVKQ